MKEYLFSYGTLQKQPVQIELFGRVLQGSSDVLRGYRATTIEIKDEAFLSKCEQKYQQTAIISKHKNDCIKGTVFEITQDDLAAADKYEPSNYKRILVLCESGNEAWLYVADETC